MNVEKGAGQYGCLRRGGPASVEILKKEIPCISNNRLRRSTEARTRNSVASLSKNSTSQHAMFRRMSKLHIEYEGINPDLRLQVIPLLNFQRKVFQRCCKNFWWRARGLKKTFYEPSLQSETSLWHPEHKGFYHFLSQINSMLRRLKNNDKGSTVRCILWGNLFWESKMVLLRADSNSVVLP